MRIILFACLFISFFSFGCETARQGAQEAGKPIGGTFKVLGGVSEGAADAYGDSGSANPYNR